MSKEKQINDMSKILSSDCGDCHKCDYFHKDIDGIEACYYKYADMLYNAGYRKQIEVVRKIITEIADFIWKGESEKMNFPFDNRYYNKQEFIAELKKKYTEGET